MNKVDGFSPRPRIACAGRSRAAGRQSRTKQRAMCEHVWETRRVAPVTPVTVHPVTPAAVQPPDKTGTSRADAQGHLYSLHDGRALSTLSACLRHHDDMSEQEPLLPTGAYDPDRGDAPKESTTWKEWTAELLESPRLHKTVIALARTSPIPCVKHCPTPSSACLCRS